MIDDNNSSFRIVVVLSACRHAALSASIFVPLVCSFSLRLSLSLSLAFREKSREAGRLCNAKLSKIQPPKEKKTFTITTHKKTRERIMR